MTTLSLVSADLSAAAVDVAARTAEGILVPWGEPGRTNLGAGVKVLRGAVRFPADGEVIGIVGHDRERPVSRLIAHEDRPEGLWGRLKIAATPAGDQLLAEIREGIRARLSVEMADLQFDADGHIAAGLMDFVAHVPRGAFDSARVHQLAAAVHHPTTDGASSVTSPAPAPEPTLTPPAPAPVLDYAQIAQHLAPMLTAAAAPGGLSTGSIGLAPSAPAAEESAVRRMATLQAALATGDKPPAELRAALADITYTDTASVWKNATSPVGAELWSGAAYRRRFVPLVTNKPLTAYTTSGWRWVTKPVVASYSGDKAEIPTNEVAVEVVSATASRCAGGWDIDRAYRDFGDAEFWAGFYAAQTESYLELSDQRAAAAIVAAARDISVDANVPTEYATLNVAQDSVLKAVALGQAILEDTPNVRMQADYVVINSADYLSLLDVAQLDAPQFLNLFGVQPGNFLRSPLVPAGKVIMGVKPALTFYELGSTPIRVEALDVAKAGIDSAVYGYTATIVNRPGGIISVPLA